MELAKPSDVNPILHFMDKNYFCEEPLSKSLQACVKSSDRILETYIKNLLSEGITILARENSFENNILGLSINQKSCEWDGDRLDKLARDAENVNIRKLLHIWALMAREPAMHNYLSQLSIFDLAFIAVIKPLQGHGLAEELARHSMSLGRDLNFKFARVNCTDDFTARIAENFDMKRLWDLSYTNILSDDEMTPVVVPESPNTHAAVYYINLKTLPEDIDELGSAKLPAKNPEANFVQS